MSATLNDVLQKINDISTYTQQSNAACRELRVNCALDASLADLSANIGQIDVDSHPDYDLPWVMADGSSGFIMPVNVNKNRNLEITAALAPSPDNNRYLAGMYRSSGGTWGLNQMTAGMRARLRLEVPPGSSADTNNYAGVNNQWTSSYPYFQPMKYAMSKQDTTSYQCSLFNGNEWIHAGSGMAQASTSTFNTYLFGVLAIPRITSSNVEFPYSGYSAVKGTRLYNAVISSGAYDSSSGKATYNPMLHWDSSSGKYRPVLYDSVNKNISSFPLDGLVDSGNDHMYYIDRSIGLEAAVASDVTEEINIQTDIYNNPNYTYYIRFNVYRYNGNQTIIWTDKGTSSTRLRYSSFVRPSGALPADTTLTFYENSSNYVNVVNSIQTASVQRVNLAVNWNMSTNSSNVSKENIAIGSATSPASNFWSKVNYSCAKNALSDRGTFTLGLSQYNFIYWFIVLDENNEMVNYVVPCIYNQNVVLYDVITKKIYTA